MARPTSLLRLALLSAAASTLLLLAEARSPDQTYHFFIRERNVTRLCHTNTILTINGQYPGPNLDVNTGDVVFVKVHNRGFKNISIHWHGVDQPRNPWADGPAYVTQCPIQPGGSFTYRIHFTEEEGTLWYHAHSDYDMWSIHGAIIIRPPRGLYPFPKQPDGEYTIILGEWFNTNIYAAFQQKMETGGGIPLSDANTINGQPGDLAPCSSSDTFKMPVEHGKTYLLRFVDAAVDNVFFVGVAGHSLTVVGADAAYTKPLTVDYITIFPGQTVTALLTANATAGRFYLLAQPFQDSSFNLFNKTNATAIVEYPSFDASRPPSRPMLPIVTDTSAAMHFQNSLRSINSKRRPSEVPKKIDKRMMITMALGKLACPPGKICEGLNGTIMASSLNNISFTDPTISILEAYYHNVRGVYSGNFPNKPAFFYNFTAPSEDQPTDWLYTNKVTKVKMLEYGDTVEVVLQSTSLLGAQTHPMHLHGHSVYRVGFGTGNYDPKKRKEYEKSYNLVDPPYQNTIAVPRGGWAAFRFTANNPGVWFMHCHFDRHLAFGMDLVFITKNGAKPHQWMRPPPPDMPLCVPKPHKENRDEAPAQPELPASGDAEM